jgi:hypothetical protein
MSEQLMTEQPVIIQPGQEYFFIKLISDICVYLGAEAPGKWLGIEETLTRYRKILWESKYFGANGKLYRTLFHKIYNVVSGPVGWYDFHAKLGD